MKVLVLTLALVLASCQTLRERLPAACERAEELHAAFVIVAATGTVSRKTIRREAAAFQGLQTLCAQEQLDLVSIAEAYAAIIEAMRLARR